MMNDRTCRAIDANIREFDEREMTEFRKFLSMEITDATDLCDCIKKASGDDDIHLDTLVRDQYFNAFLKMHIS